MAGGGGLPVPAPLVAGDLLLLTSNHRPLVAGHPIKPVFAVKRSATGTLPLPTDDDPGEHVAWSLARVGSYIQTPVVYRDLLYVCQGSGILYVLDAKTGARHSRLRLGGGRVGFSASPVAGDGKVYVTSEEGDVHVLRAGKDCETLATNKMGEICMATPALARGMLFFRTRHHVVAIDGETGRTR